MASTQVTAGVDLGGTKIQTVVLRDREVAGSARMLTPHTGSAADVIAAIASTVAESLEQAGAEPSALAGLGIGTPGEIDPEAGVVVRAPNVPGFAERVELGPLLSEAIGGAKVTVDNDVRVGVLGEFHRGAGRPYRNVLGVWVGTGVGGGMILDGTLRAGRGSAGEIGHLIVQPRGRRCSCGRRGCLEAYAGRWCMEQRARRLHDRGFKTSLFRIMKERERERLSSGVWSQALEESDRLAKRLLDQAAWALGIALASAQNLLDLEAIVVGGGLGDRLGPPFVEQIVEQMTPHLFKPDSPPAVLTTELQDLSGAVGAAVLVGG
jgi:glucokinase